MDLVEITTVSFILFLLMLVPPFIKRAHHRRQCEKLLREYRDSCKEYDEAGPEEQMALPDNVVSLKDYKERRI